MKFDYGTTIAMHKWHARFPQKAKYVVVRYTLVCEHHIFQLSQACVNSPSRSKGPWLHTTHLITGCVGRGVRLGSQSSSAESGNLMKSKLRIRKSGTHTKFDYEDLQNEIRRAQNIGRVLISRSRNTTPDSFW